MGIPTVAYNGDSHETLDKVNNVKYILPKGAFMSKPVATFVQKVGLIWLNGGFISVIWDTNVIVSFKLLTTLTNVIMVLCAQGKKLNLI